MKSLTQILVIFLWSIIKADGQSIIFVSPNGNDKNEGTINSPFKSVNTAIEQLTSLPDGGSVLIWLRGGDYEISDEIILSKQITSKFKSISISAYNKENVKLVGGKSVNTSNLEKVANASVLCRLPKSAIGKVLVVNLEDLGILKAQELKQYGYGLPLKPVSLEIFGNGQVLNLCRWPNDSLLDIGEVVNVSKTDKEETMKYPVFHFGFDKPVNWKPSANIWVAGKFSAGWASDNFEIDSMNVNDRTLRLKGVPKYPVVGPKRVGDKLVRSTTDGRGYYFYNVLEELDQPGEWYLDLVSRKIYLWPSSDEKSMEIQISIMEQPFFKITDSKNITLKNLTFSASRGNGIEIDNSDLVSVIGCKFMNIGLRAVVTKFCSNFLFRDCLVTGMGAGGVSLGGGDRKKLVAANNIVENSEFTNYSRLYRSYTPAVSIGGVGAKVLHNKIHDSPDQAIIYTGNNHFIANNRIIRVCTDFSDMGAIYTGRDPSSTGTVIENNLFEEINNNFSDMIAAVYIDDGSGGILVNKNVFFKCGGKSVNGFGAVHINGGADNQLKNNVFIDCAKALSNTAWNDKKWKEMYVTNPFYVKKITEDVDIRSSVYLAKYKHLTAFFDTTHVHARNNYISNTTLYGVSKTFSGQGLIENNTYTFNKKLPLTNQLFQDLNSIRVPEEVKKWKGWEPVDWDKIRQ